MNQISMRKLTLMASKVITLSELREITHMRKSLRTSDFLNFLVILTLVVGGIWYRHGAFESYSISWQASWQATAQILGLYAQLSMIFAIVLASRAGYLEKAIGLDNMLVWHRWLGEAAAVFLILHISAEVIALRFSIGLYQSILSLTGKQSYMAQATIGSLGILVVTLTSLKFIRRKLSYETWYYLHLLVYASILLGFFHQIYLGYDFASDNIAKNFWIGINVLALTIAILGRWGGLLISLVNPYIITQVSRVGTNSTELTLSGKIKKGIPGQFAIIRGLNKDYWWQPHPFSLSSVESNGDLKFTIRDLGEGSAGFTQMRIGTKVAVEGPYGAITSELLGDKKILMIAGGVGIAPVRALLSSLDPVNEPIVIYRSGNLNDSPHLNELVEISTRLHGRVIPVIGGRETLTKDPFSPQGLKDLVPDIASREVVLCGPELLIDKAVISLIRLKVPIENIHHERLWW